MAARPVPLSWRVCMRGGSSLACAACPSIAIDPALALDPGCPGAKPVCAGCAHGERHLHPRCRQRRAPPPPIRGARPGLRMYDVDAEPTGLLLATDLDRDPDLASLRARFDLLPTTSLATARDIARNIRLAP